MSTKPDATPVRFREDRSRRGARSLRPRGPHLLVAVMTVAMVAGVAACAPTVEDTRSATAGMPDTRQQLAAHDWALDHGASSLRTKSTNPITLTFSNDHLVSGSGPCNTYRGKYSIDEDTVKLIDVAPQTRKACDPVTTRAEREYLSALEAVRDVDASDRNRLVLTGPSSSKLTFRAQDTD